MLNIKYFLTKNVFGLNAAMIIYLLKKRRAQLEGKNIAVGFGGIATGIIGVGCAVCGSFLLSIMLSMIGASSTLVFLSFKGGEFGILSVIFLAASLTLMSKKITDPLTCKVE